MTRAWPYFIAGIQAAYSRYGNNLLGAAAAEGGVTRVWNGGHGEVTTYAPPDTAQHVPGRLV